MPMSPRLLRPLASSVHPEAANWAARVVTNGGTVSGGTLAAVSKFCADIDAAGIRGKLYRLNLFCGNQLEACLVPLYRSESSTAAARGNATDTNVNFVSGDFNSTGSSSGLKGNGSNKYLNTGYPLNANTASSSHMAVMVLATQTSGNFEKTACGAYSSSGQITWSIDLMRPSAAVNNYRRSASMGTYATDSGYFGELINSSPLSGGNILISAGTKYRNGSAVGTSAAAIANYPAAHSMFVFAFNNGVGSTVIGHTDARLGGYSVGLSMTAAEALAYSNAINAFNTALSRT